MGVLGRAASRPFFFFLSLMRRASPSSGDTLRKKPHPAPLRLALEQMCLEPGACVYVGDSPEDLEMARRARVRAIAVLGPFPTEQRLRAAKPELLLNSICDLPAAVRQLCE